MPAGACPICGGAAAPIRVPVQVRRDGRQILRIEVPARACGECGYIDIADTAREQLIATLECETRPGDDIVFPVEG